MASFVEFFVRRYKIDVVLCVLYRFSYDLLFHVFLTDQNFRWVDWFWFIRKNLLCKPSIIKQLEIIYRAQQGMLENQFQVNPKMSRVESVKMNLSPGLDSSIHIYCNGPITSLCKKKHEGSECFVTNDNHHRHHLDNEYMHKQEQNP